MSLDNVTAFAEWIGAEKALGRELADASPSAVVAAAARQGYEFTEEELAAMLRSRLHAAESLPRPWGWPLARRLGLVHG